MRARVRVLAAAAIVIPGVAEAKPLPPCESVILESQVTAGHSFEAVFSPGMKFVLEAIASGWIIRVVPADAPRSNHDYAELATPPYQSVTPLAVSTDFSFRAQDAVGWNPRRFRFAAGASEFARLQRLYEPAMRGDARAMAELASVATAQPEAELTILDAQIAPGTNDQWQMAAAVASHFEATPHSVVTSAASPLGKVLSLRFRVVFFLPPELRPLAGSHVESGPCRTGLASGSKQPQAR